MAGLGRKVWSAGEVATAANIQGYLQDQVVQVFGGSAARWSALGTSESEGMVTYLKDSNTLECYFDGVWHRVNGSTVFTFPAIGAGYAIELPIYNNSTILASGTGSIGLNITDILAIGDRIDIVRDCAGTVSITAGSGVTTWAGAGTAGTAVTFKIDQQYNAATVLKVASNSYRVIGRVIV